MNSKSPTIDRPSLSPAIIQGRTRLKEGRERARRLHDSGARGTQVSALISDLYDDLVLDVWNAACAEYFGGDPPPGIALVAHGGFGRRDLAPYSDADLMVIVRSRWTAAGERLAQKLTRDLVDIGLDLGFSMRTPGEACSLSWSDAVIFTSLTESRLLAGSLKVFKQFFESLRRGAMRRGGALIQNVIAARKKERQKWGETNYLLQPNLKKSRGGLRDIQMIRWIGFARVGEVDLDRLLRLGVLTAEDHSMIRRAYEYLIRLRNELHFRESRAQDVLDRPTQMEIAKVWGYTGSEGVLPVEAFMQHYFDVTGDVRYSARFFADDNRSRPWLGRLQEWLLSTRIGKHALMGPTHIWVRSRDLDEFASDLPRVLRFMSVANHNNRRIGHQTWQAIRKAMKERENVRPDAESVGAFLSLLSRGNRLAPLLRRLHELRIIEQVIPDFKRTRGLLQFNAYHKYTVDAHSIRAVEAATDFADDQSAIGRRYRRLKDKTLLHLALLIHDMGKGYEEDHSIVGARLARVTAERLDLDESSGKILEWLVLKHLLVNTIAFRHDLNDPEIVLSFAKEVGSIRRLELLIVHSVADLAAVGPGVLTDWKLKLIEDLYLRTRQYFESGDLQNDQDGLATEIRDQVIDHLDHPHAESSSRKLLSHVPLSMLRRGRPEEFAAQLNQVAAALDAGKPSLCLHHYDPIPSAQRYIVIHQQRDRRVGVFSRVTGAFLSCGVNILRAEIVSLGDVVWDEFWVDDPDYPDELPPDRIKKIQDRVTFLLDTPDAPLPSQRRVWSVGKKRESAAVKVLPTKVDFDNDTLERFTILSLFAYDQTGLLYRIASALSGMNLELHFAKIDTHLDQIADVFYITEANGKQLRSEDRQQQVRTVLMDVVSMDQETNLL